MNLGGWETLGWALLATGLLMLLLAVWIAVRRNRRLRRPHQLGGRMGPAEVRAPEAGLLDGDESSSRDGASDPWSESTIYGLAQQLAKAVDKLEGNTRAEARREAEMAAAKIRADAEVEARWQVLEPARAEANAESNAMIAEAQREVQRIKANAVEEAQGTIEAAKTTADRLWSDTGNRMHRLTEGLNSAASNIDSLKTAAYG